MGCWWGRRGRGGGVGMLGTVRHASERHQIQNVRSITERRESQKGNFYHDVGHVSWGALTKNNNAEVFPLQ